MSTDAPVTMAAALAPASGPAERSGRAAAAESRGLFADLTPASTLVAPAAAELTDRWSPRPGQTAQLAEAWSVEHEQTAGDLSFDFVSPELVLAARIYGFAPAQIAQVARLASSGRAGLAAMAAGVDLAFTEAMTARGSVALSAGAQAVAGGPAIHAPSPTYVSAALSAHPERGGRAAAAESTGSPPAFAMPHAPAAPRLPRGPFLWPESAADSLGIRGERSNDSQPNSLAALDLLAAYVVAQAGAESLAAPPDAVETAVVRAEAAVMARAFAPAAGRPLPSEFQAIYIALAQSPAGQSLSPAVRAARALAIAEETAPGSARARAAAAWAVLPVVMGADAAVDHSAPAAADEPADLPVIRPRGPAVAARAGESLRSLVAPSERRAAWGDDDEAPQPARAGAARAERAPFAEMVQTGATTEEVARAMASHAHANADQVGGGVPAWFESVARRLLEEQSGSGNEGMTLAEMVLVTAAPARHVAAAPRSADSAPAQASPSPTSDGEKADVEELAHKVYGEICRLIEIARERSGDPWLR